MGVVHRARDTELGRDVALKRVIAVESPDAVRRFLVEARGMARLAHPGIVPIHELGTDDDGKPFIVMPFVAGRTLDRLADGAAIDPDRAAEIVERLARAIDHAHAHGVLHRDLKPQNVIVDDETGDPSILDFGLAVLFDTPEERITLSGERAIVGTVAYMPPEQANGEEATPRSDIYGLGAILYHLLTGRAPFGGSGKTPPLALLVTVLTTDPPPPRALEPGVPPALDAVCRLAMAKRPEERPPSAGALADAIAAARAAPEDGAVAGSNGLPGGRALGLGLGAVGALGAVVGVVAALTLGAPDDRDRVRPSAGTEAPAPRPADPSTEEPPRGAMPARPDRDPRLELRLELASPPTTRITVVRAGSRSAAVGVAARGTRIVALDLDDGREMWRSTRRTALPWSAPGIDRSRPSRPRAVAIVAGEDGRPPAIGWWDVFGASGDPVLSRELPELAGGPLPPWPCAPVAPDRYEGARALLIDDLENRRPPIRVLGIPADPDRPVWALEPAARPTWPEIEDDGGEDRLGRLAHQLVPTWDAARREAGVLLAYGSWPATFGVPSSPDGVEPVAPRFAIRRPRLARPGRLTTGIKPIEAPEDGGAIALAVAVEANSPLEVIVLDRDGRTELFRTLPAAYVHLGWEDLDGDGASELVLVDETGGIEARDGRTGALLGPRVEGGVRPPVGHGDRIAAVAGPGPRVAIGGELVEEPGVWALRIVDLASGDLVATHDLSGEPVTYVDAGPGASSATEIVVLTGKTLRILSLVEDR